MTKWFKNSLMILVVDDDDLNQQMMNILLSGQGHVVKTALNGQEALDAVMSSKFDLVFMDLQLPDMSGLDVSKRIREWEAGKSHLPIIALTANDLPGAALEWLRAGVDDYIFKPYNLGQLSRMMTLYVNNQDTLSASNGDNAGNNVRNDDATFDPELALLNFSNNVDAYKELLDDFIVSLPERVERMYQATGSLKGLAAQAHNLKGVSANLGAMQLSISASQLERYCKDNRKQLVEATLTEIKNMVSALQTEVMDFLKP